MEINLYATLRPIVGQKTIEVELKPGANEIGRAHV